MRREWERETDELYHSIASLEERNLELRAENQNLILARQERECAGKGSLEHELFHKNGEIWKLSSRLGKMNALASFAQHDPSVKATIDEYEVTTWLKDIASELDALSTGVDPRTALVLPKIAENSELCLLIRSVFQGSRNTGEEVVQLKRCVLKYGLEIFIKTLCVAAVRDWVFYSDFPNFDPDDARLLNAYRECVMIHDGWDRLRNLELASYHRLIDNPRFRESLIRNRAQGMTNRFLRVFAPLFVDLEEEHQVKEVESWGERTETYVERQFRVKAIFKSALELKAATVTANQRFEFVLFPPGTLHRESDSSTLGDDDTWKMAAFYVYSTDTAIIEHTMATALVQQRYFIAVAEEQRNSSTQYQKLLLLPRREDASEAILISYQKSHAPLNDITHSKEQGDTPQLQEHANNKGSETNANRANGVRSKGVTNISLQHPATCRGCKEKYSVIQELIDHRRDNLICGPPLGVNDVLRLMERDARDTTKQNQGHQSSSTSLNKFSVTPKLWRRDNRAQDSVEDGSRTKKNLDRSQQQEFGDTELPEDSKSISNMLENASRASEETSQSALPSVKPNAEGRYECPLCSKDYAESRGMQKHWRTHPVCMREGHRVDRAEFEVERGKIACKECGALVSTKGMKSHDSQHPKTRTSGDVVYGRTASSPGSGNFRPSPKEISSSAKRSKSPMIETRVDGTDSVKKMIGKKRRRAEDDSDDDWRPPPRDF